MTADRTETLAAQLAELRALDLTGLPPSTPVTEAELTDLEHALGVALPTTYRNFLLRVGTGPGPYYGLHRVADLHVNAKDRGDTAGLFPLTPADFEEHFVTARARSIEMDFDAPGCLEIGHQGCSDTTVLILTGELAGTVCDQWENQWAPARTPLGSTNALELGLTPTLDEWYGAWLTGRLAALQK
ncbi:SMI1/KNR4 family protein [Lentzea sp. BCCO 10_0856]|uniref:SMI1/KNR4 family protein n=1 Tax=Lentzea miocenica TaxID=3095431 RepID=A0ABU4TFM5_9PSEU|nr:SMI1/KNR4 family protein [Lentzea sp. BCCO 10_0856]MDX8036973.1 SMI1/KNR4 family protein [Lentzea sp. BCCO 10_0856]